MMKIYEEALLENAEGYERARIPGIIRTERGNIIVYCELRNGDSDWSVIDIGMKKSEDGGKSFSQRKILVSGENENTVNNPLMIADGDVIHFLYCVNYHRVFYMKSCDEGDSWSEPIELTDSIKEQTGNFFWSCIATGPTHGIRLSSGRLLVPIWLAFNKEDERSHHPSVISVLYSDDKGVSWKVGEIYKELADPSEFSVAQLSNGSIVANIRHENEEKCRAVGIINENAKISAVHFAQNLPDPVCCGGMCGFGEELYFTNCESEISRINLTLKKIHGEEVTDKLFLSEKGGYSDIALSADGRNAYVVYEHEKTLKLISVFIG